MFGPGNGVIGTSGFMLHGLADTYGATGVPLLAFWVFQFAFADTCSTIATGAMVGRCRFVGNLLYTVGVTGFVYPIIGHWAWGPDGWLATLSPVPFRDFAGSTVVHSIGGAVSLAGAIVLGPRIGRVFARDGGGPMSPHNVILGASGGLMLWFCWYGFNPGSTLSAMDASASRAWPSTPRWRPAPAAWRRCSTRRHETSTGASPPRPTACWQAWSPSRAPATG